jgi:hypothetical protein
MLASSSLAIAEQMVWKVVSTSGLVSATVYNDRRVCHKALRHFKNGSTCVAVPKN